MNLANLYFLSKNYDKALAEYQRLEGGLKGQGPLTASLWINISKCQNALGNAAKASEYLAKASVLDPNLAAKYAFLAQAPDSTGKRASEIGADAEGIVFGE
jgi:predicted Zn-dependent protease